MSGQVLEYEFEKRDHQKIAKGENRLSRLFNAMQQAGDTMEHISIAMSDGDFRVKMYKKYNIK